MLVKSQHVGTERDRAHQMADERVVDVEEHVVDEVGASKRKAKPEEHGKGAAGSRADRCFGIDATITQPMTNWATTLDHAKAIAPLPDFARRRSTPWTVRG